MRIEHQGGPCEWHGYIKHSARHETEEDGNINAILNHLEYLEIPITTKYPLAYLAMLFTHEEIGKCSCS